MQEVAYGAINTTVRVRESTFLTSSDYDAMLRANALEDAIAVLRKTDYHVPDDILETKDFEGFLNQSLKEVYAELYAGIPDREIIDIFALRYDYHNLKVLFKEWYAEKDFESMYLPFGRYEIETLRRVVKTSEDKVVHPVMLKSINDVKSYYEDFKDMNGISILLDNAYLEHLAALRDGIDSNEVDEYIDAIINLENLSTLIRGMKQERSQGFLKIITNTNGSIEQGELMAYADSKDYSGLLKKFTQLNYGEPLETLIDSSETMDVVAVDAKISEIKADLMQQANLKAFGPMPSLAYLYFKENEISNIRLILTAKDYGLDKEKIEERMRPIYGL